LYFVDESDSDVEILREEKNEDLDVIFVAETTVKAVTQIEMGAGGVDPVKTVQSCENLQGNIRVDLAMGACANDDGSPAVTTPLDLSSKKCPDDDLDLDPSSSFMTEQTANTFSNFISNVKMLSKSDSLCVSSSCDNPDPKTMDTHTDQYPKKMDLFDSTLSPGTSLSTADLSDIDCLPAVIPPNASVSDVPVVYSDDINKPSNKRQASSENIDIRKKVKKEIDIFNTEEWKSLDLDFLTESSSSTCLSRSSCDNKPVAGPSVPSGPSGPAASAVCGRSFSVSSETSTKHLPPKKQSCFRQTSDPGIQARPPSPQPSCSSWGSEKCTSCNISLLGFRISRCLQGHPTCAFCLEEQVKLVLTGKTKVESV
jgi:hypothetical protein